MMDDVVKGNVMSLKLSIAFTFKQVEVFVDRQALLVVTTTAAYY